MRNTLKLALVLLASIVTASHSSAAEPIKALIVTGQNNHNWELSHVMLRDILQNTGLFTVEIAQTPAQGGNMGSFAPEFEKYDVVVLDYNGDRWSHNTDERFLAYVQRGGGVVVYHAADNAFANWEEFNKITALGGWEGRDKSSGPYAYWKEGGLFLDYQSDGTGGSHGQQHEYYLTLRNADHPITRGMPSSSLHSRDEMYDRMRGPGNVKDVLYTSFSETEKGGSGREEILIFTVDYGKARIFHTMLGHVGDLAENSPAVNCEFFKTTFVRGAQWAARGEVGE